SGQRLHPERLGLQFKMVETATVELTWLKEMLAQRSGEPAPASGWVRYQSLGQPKEPGAPEWEEINVYSVIATRQGVIGSQVGTDIESYADLYAQWLTCRRFSPLRKQVLSRQIARWAYRPMIIPIIIDEQDNPYALGVTLQSIAAQAYACESVLLLSNGRQAVDNHVLRLGLQADWAQQLNGL
ncbi:glycosyl transferase family 2, partial [Pseudomonas palleroniana]